MAFSNHVGRVSPATNTRLTVESEIMMKLQVRTAVVMGIAAALFVSAAPTADAGGLLSKLFKCKKEEEATCCCPAPEPEPVCCEPAPEPACCEPAPAPEPVCCEPEPEPVCCETAPEPEPVCCEPAPEPACCEPEPAPEPVCCEPEPEPAPCCASWTPQNYPLPKLAEGEVLISISPINFDVEPVEIATQQGTSIIQIASAK